MQRTVSAVILLVCAFQRQNGPLLVSCQEDDQELTDDMMERWTDWDGNQRLAALNNIDIILYGDSVLAGMKGGEPAEVWQRHHGHQRTINMASAGDSTYSLRWRLNKAALPPDAHTKQAVVWIGSMDLLSTSSPSEVITDDEAIKKAHRIYAICNRLMQHSPNMQLILMAVLPRGRGGGYAGVESLEELAGLPNRYSVPIAIINLLLRQFADHHERVHFVDCTPWFVTADPEVPGGVKINTEYAPDVLHFNEKGYEVMLTECLDPALAYHNNP